MGCTPFATTSACVDFTTAFTGYLCTAVPASVCAPLPVNYTLLVASTRHSDELAALPAGTVVTRITADPGSAKYIAAVRSALSQFNFSLAVFTDSLYELLAVSYPRQRMLAVYAGGQEARGAFVASVSMPPIGYITGVAVAANTLSGDVGFSSTGFEQQKRHLFYGFRSGVRSRCPACRIFLCTDGTQQYWPSTIDSAAYSDAPVRSNVSFSIVVNMPDCVILKRTGSVTIDLSSTLGGLATSLLTNYRDGHVFIDWTLPGMADLTFNSFVNASNVIQETFELVTSTQSFDAGVTGDDFVEDRVVAQLPAPYQLYELASPIEGAGSSPSGTRFYRGIDQFFLGVSPRTSDVRIYNAASLIDRNASVHVDNGRPPARIDAAVATRYFSEARVEAYVVFGRNASNTDERFGDIWRLESYVGDYHQYDWSLAYSLSEAIKKNPTLVELPLETYGHTASIAGGELFMFGGFTDRRGAPNRILFALDLAANRWRQLNVVGVIGRGNHFASMFETGGHVGDLVDSQILVVGFGQAQAGYENVLIQAIGLTTQRAVTIDVPRYPNGTRIITGTASQTCMTSTATMLIVTEAIPVVDGSTVCDVTVCKYSMQDGAWEGCRHMRGDLGTADPTNCGAITDPVLITRRAILFFSATRPPTAFAEDDVYCNGQDNLVVSPGGWSCRPCPEDSFAALGQCVKCADRNASHPTLTANVRCREQDVRVIPIAIGSTFGTLLCIAVIAIGIYYRSQKDVRHSHTAEDLVEDVTRAVATGFIAPVEYLYELRRPNRMQRSVVNILRLFDAYAQFIPGWVFRGDRKGNDFDSPTDNSVSVSVSSVSAPHYSRKRLLEKRRLQQIDGGDDTRDDDKDKDNHNHRRIITRRGSSRTSEAVSLQISDEASESMLYRPRFTDNVTYNADVSVLCMKLHIDGAEPAAVKLLDRILTIVVNTVDDGDGLISSMWGDQIIAVFNGLMTNDHHIRDAATTVCILAESLDALGHTCTFGLSRGYAKVGVVNGLFGQRGILVGDVLERAREMTVANRVLRSQILCDWAAGSYLGAAFSLRLIGYWCRTPQHKYLVAEMLGMAQNDDAAVRVQETFEAAGTNLRVRVCLKDHSAVNSLMLAIDKGDDRRRDLLIQQCRMTQAIREPALRSLIENGLPQFTQETTLDAGTR
jgi:hypothetical protein